MQTVLFLTGRVEPDSRGSTPTQDNGHYPAVVTSNSSLPSLLNVGHKPQEPPPPGEGPPLIMPGPGGPPPPPPGAGAAGQARMRCQSFDGMSLLLLVSEGKVNGACWTGMSLLLFLKFLVQSLPSGPFSFEGKWLTFILLDWSFSS